MRKRRSELWKISDAVQPLVDQFMDLSEEEQAVFLDMVDPLPEEPELEVKPAKKTRKKSNKPASKSARGQSLSNVIQRTAKVRVDDDDEDGPRCTFIMGDNVPCNDTEHSLVHKRDGGYLGYHEFQPAGKSSAPRAGVKSSMNGAEQSSTPNLETETADASSAVHAGG